MQNRKEFFLKLEIDPWHKRLFKRLRADEKQLCINTLDQLADMSCSDFEMAINRLFLDKPKPKNWTIIADLLTAANINFQSAMNPDFYKKFLRQ